MCYWVTALVDLDIGASIAVESLIALDKLNTHSRAL